MTDTLPERIAFEFADHQLIGTIVDTTVTATFNHPPETMLTVEARGSRYTISRDQIVQPVPR